jgi:tight adherence protein B
MRRAATFALLCSTALAMVCAPALGADRLKVSPGADVQFPTRALVLTLPIGTALSASQVQVTENGKPVPNLTVTSSTATSSKHFGVVLLIDASPRMRRSIEAALAAARAFAAHRNPHHPLAALAFNNKTTTLAPLTYSQDTIQAALSRPPAFGNERHLYDAVSGAIALLRRGRGINGSVVVISDGSDTGSKATADDVVAQARTAGIRLYTAGIPDAAGYDGSSLQTLASGTAGEYLSAAKQDDLVKVLDQLGTRIASEYLVGYRSLAGPRQHVDVRVAVDGLGSGTLVYTTPALRRYPGNTVAEDSFLRSTSAMILVALLCALLVGIVVALLLRPDPDSVRARMAQFVSGPVEGVEDPASKTAATVAPVKAEEPSPVEREWWANLKLELEIARIELPAQHLAVMTAIATVLAFVFLVAVTGSAAIALLALFVPVFIRGLVRRRLDEQRNLFADQLADGLQVVASAMRVGHSFPGALGVAAQESAEPTRSEIERVLVDEQRGVPLEVGLETLADRMKSSDVAQLALVATVQRETGGNTAEVLDRVTESIRDHAELRGMIRTLTAQGRLTRWILTFLPVVVFLLMLSASGDYMDPLLHTSGGHILIAFSIALVIGGSLAIKRIIEIEV